MLRTDQLILAIRRISQSGCAAARVTGRGPCVFARSVAAHAPTEYCALGRELPVVVARE